MRQSQLDFLCKTFGNPDLPDNEKWKCIKYIFVENPIADVQKLIKTGDIKYIANSSNGPGFYIMDIPNADFGIADINKKVVTFVPLKIIDKISIIIGSYDNTLYKFFDGGTISNSYNKDYIIIDLDKNAKEEDLNA